MWLFIRAVLFGDLNWLDRLLNNPKQLAQQPVVVCTLPNGEEITDLAINQRDINGNCALHHAVMKNKPEMVQRLLQVPGITINAPNLLFQTPLMLAVIYNNETIVNLLLNDLRVCIRTIDKKEGKTALIHAASKGCIPLVERLLHHSITAACVRDKQCKNAIDYLYEKGHINQLSPRALEIIKKIYPEFSVEDSTSLTVLSRHQEIALRDVASHFKISIDYKQLADFILEINKEIIEEDILKILSKYPEITLFELDKLYEVKQDIIDPLTLITPALLIRRAANQGNLIAMNWLLNYDLENKDKIKPVSQPENNYNTILHLVRKAANQGSLIAIALLLNHDLKDKPVNQQNNNGDTALHLAVLNRHPEVVQRLLKEEGVLAYTRNHLGQTPILLAVGNNDETVVKILLEHSKINPVEFHKKNNIAAIEAAKYGYIPIVEIFLYYDGRVIFDRDEEEKNVLNYLYENSTITQLALEAIAHIKTINPAFSLEDPDSFISRDFLRKRSGTLSSVGTPPQLQLPVRLSWTSGMGTKVVGKGRGRGRGGVSFASPPGIALLDPTPAVMKVSNEQTTTSGILSRIPNSVREKKHANVPSSPMDVCEYGSGDEKAGKRPPPDPLLRAAPKSPKSELPDGDDGLTPLMCAIIEGDVRKVEVLLNDPHTDVQAKNSDNQTSLELLIDLYEADDDSKITPENFREIMKLLLEHLVNALPKKKIQLNVDEQPMVLRCAAQVDRVDLINQLLKQYPDIAINAPDRQGQAALVLATIEGHQEVVRELLKHSKIEPSKPDSFGQTALGWAVENNHQEIVECLLEHSGSEDAINLADCEGYTPLTRAVFQGDLESAEKLLKHRSIDINQKDTQGQTPLMLAAALNRPDMAKRLLEHGADPTIKNYWGQTALAIAQVLEHSEITKQLPSGSSDKAASLATAPIQPTVSQQLEQTVIISWLLTQLAKLHKRGVARVGDVAGIIHGLAVKYGVLPPVDHEQCCSGVQGLSQEIAAMYMSQGTSTTRPPVPGPRRFRQMFAGPSSSHNPRNLH